MSMFRRPGRGDKRPGPVAVVGPGLLGCALAAVVALSGLGQALAQGVGGKAPTSGDWVAAAGRVEPYSEEMRLGFDIPGKIVDVYVEEGDRVAKGQVLWPGWWTAICWPG